MGRFGQVPQRVEIASPATVSAVLTKLGIEISKSEKVWVNGERATARTRVEMNDIVAVVSPKEAGR